VSSGGNVWQASQAKPVCRAKGGMALAGCATSINADPPRRIVATAPSVENLTGDNPDLSSRRSF
jgi:hypothetical protein